MVGDNATRVVGTDQPTPKNTDDGGSDPPSDEITMDYRQPEPESLS